MSNADELWKLKQLLDSGAITADEFEAEKKKVLQAQPVVQPRPQKLKKYRLERALSVAGMAFAIYCSFFTFFNYLQTYFPFEDISRGFVHDVPKNLIILCVSIITLFLAIFRGNRPVLLLACNLITGITVGICHTSYVTLSAGIVLVIPTVMLAVKLLSKYKEKAKKARFYEWAWLWTLLVIGAYWVWLFLPVHQPAVTVSGETAYFNTTMEKFVEGFQERTPIHLPVLQFGEPEVIDEDGGKQYTGLSDDNPIAVVCVTDANDKIETAIIYTTKNRIDAQGYMDEEAGEDLGSYANAVLHELHANTSVLEEIMQTDYSDLQYYDIEIENNIMYGFQYSFNGDTELEDFTIRIDAVWDTET